MTEVATTTLNPRVRSACERVWVAPDRTAALVDGHRIDADTPRELRRVLAEHLYEKFHSGQRVGHGDLPFRLRDPGFDSELTEAVPHRETTAAALVCAAPPGMDAGGALLVQREGVRIWVPPEVVVEGAPEVGSRVTLTVSALRPALSPGFFLVEGSRSKEGDEDSETLRVYVHITEDTCASEIFTKVLEELEGCAADYRAKILSTRLLYPRRDALVVYLRDTRRHELAERLATALRSTPGVGEDTSLFATLLAPGIATACEPRDRRPALRGLSFGQHRATALAHALVDCAQDLAGRDTAIEKHFAEAGIDLAEPALNAHETETPTDVVAMT